MILAWLILIPFAGGVLAALAGRRNEAAPRWICLLAMATELAVVAGMWSGAISRPDRLDLPWIPAFGARFILSMDGLSLLMTALTAALGLTAVLAGWKYVAGCVEGVPPSSECVEGGMPATQPMLYFLLMWMLAGIVGIFLAMDLLLFYFFWEMAIIPLCFLISIYGGPARKAAAIKTFVFAQVSGLLLLAATLGLALAHARAFPDSPFTFSYFQLIGTPLSSAAAFWLMLGFFAAFAVKLPALGFHSWLPDAHEQSPVSGAVDISGLVIKVGAYGLLRFVAPLFPHTPDGFATAIRALAVAGILYGGVLAFAQSDLKRMVAYIGVSHMGFVLLGAMGRNELAFQGAVMLIIAGGVGSAAMFVVVGAVHARTGRRELRYLGGLWRAMPALGGAGMFFALAAMGLPATAGFVGEALVLAGTFQTSPVFAAVAAGGLVVSVIYALWFVRKVFQGPPPSMEETDVVARDLDARERLMLAPAIVIILWLGLYPRAVLDTSAPAVRQLIGGTGPWGPQAGFPACDIGPQPGKAVPLNSEGGSP